MQGVAHFRHSCRLQILEILEFLFQINPGPYNDSAGKKSESLQIETTPFYFSGGARGLFTRLFLEFELTRYQEFSLEMVDV